MEAAPEPLPVPTTPGDPNVGSGDLTVGSGDLTVGSGDLTVGVSVVASVVGSVVPILPRVLSGITISGGGSVPIYDKLAIYSSIATNKNQVKSKESNFCLATGPRLLVQSIAGSAAGCYGYNCIFYLTQMWLD